MPTHRRLILAVSLVAAMAALPAAASGPGEGGLWDLVAKVVELFTGETSASGDDSEVAPFITPSG